MNKTMIRFDYAQLRNETHVEYHSEFIAAATKFNPDNLIFNPVYKTYTAAHEAETNLLDEMRKSVYTDLITAQDEKRDEVFRGFHLTVQANTHHFEQDKRERGIRLAIVFKNYGNIAKKTFDAETAAIDDLLRELKKTPFLNDIQNLKLDDWVNQLQYENEQFKRLMEARYEESGNRPNDNMRHLRGETDHAFRALLNVLDVFILLNQDTGYPLLADNVNAIAERYKNILAQEAGMRKPKKTN
ncbi:MAG: DUF6261 family protein [Prevotellaceae bacterium]|jgi:hypothetical protein|nr:DUF6261 family protein [Prevotellaceae bacterium]